MTDENINIQEFISSARKLYSDGLIHEAGRILQQAVSTKPEQLESVHSLGLAALEMEHEALALALFQRAREIDPDCMPAHYNLGNIRMDRGELDEAIICFNAALKIDPEYANAHYNLGLIFIDLGRIDEAIESFRKATHAVPDYFQAFYSLAKALGMSGNFKEALTCYRRCIEINPQDKSSFKMIARAGDQIKMLEEILKPDFIDTLAHSIDNFHDDKFMEVHKKSLALKRGGNEIILVVSFPKSGSTLLANTLLQLSDYRWFRLCYRYEQNEHDLYLPYLSMWNKHGVVSLLHMKATVPNVELINLFDICPVITVRNIYDTVASLFNNLNQGKLDSTKAKGGSFLWQDQQIMALSDERKIDCLIDTAVPWCINYYVSWVHFTQTGQCRAIWVDFDKQMENWEITLSEVCDFTGLGHKCTDAALASLKQPRHSPYNSGNPKAGINLLSAKQKKRILDMVSYYPEVDFAEHGFLRRAPEGDGTYSLDL